MNERLAMNVTKRDGSIVPLDIEKIHQVLEWACEGLKKVSVSDIEINANLQFNNKIKTSDIHSILIKSAVDLISERNPNYEFVASRLVVMDVRKKVYGGYEPVAFKTLIEQNVKAKKYDPIILDTYNNAEIIELQKYIKYDRDYTFTYAGLRQLVDKYFVQNRKSNKLYECPQEMFMLIGMYMFQKYEPVARMFFIKRFYDKISTHKISLPTPIISGVRTILKQFASCCLIDVDDNIPSLVGSKSAVALYTAARSGIGLNWRVRGIGAEVKDGDVIHSGITPFLRSYQATTKELSQGTRGGSSTSHFCFFTWEIEDIIVLKNNKGVEENRVRGMDYSIAISSLLLERAKNNDEFTVFSLEDVPDLYEAFYTDSEAFKTLYEKYERKTSIRKKRINAREFVNNLLTERFETGRIYLMFVDNVVAQNRFEDPVYMSNLCVAPETKILTDKGYEVISELADVEVNVWNGEEFSKTVVRKTGENQKLIKVVTDVGSTIECTEYHKFYVLKNYRQQYVERRACELKDGDKLIKTAYPILEGSENMSSAWENGFYSGDGCFHKGTHLVYLYHKKKKLLSHFSSDLIRTYSENKDRIILRCDMNYDKFFVPNNKFTIKSRLEWLSGWLDADGCIYKNGTNQQIVGSSIDEVFLCEIKNMLQCTGIDSKIQKVSDGGYRSFPKNNGTNDVGEYMTKPAYRLIINSVESKKLYDMGLRFKRLEFTPNIPNRSASHYTKVVEVVDEGRYDDTYCFTEPIRNMGVFNGVLTGNCQEILLPTKPIVHIDDNEGEIATCILSCVNAGKIEDDEDFEECCDIMVRFLDELIDYQEYPVNAAKNSTINRRNLGIGVSDYFHMLAKNKVRYDTQEALDLTHNFMEKFQYYLIKASNALAKEKGACAYSHLSKYSKGILPIDLYNKNVDDLTKPSYVCDWEALREDLKLYGIRHSVLSAIPPTSSSSLVSNSTPGIDAPRSLLTVKVSKKGTVKQLVPNYSKYSTYYTTAWELNNIQYLKLIAVMQKFIDQSISTNEYFDIKKYPNNIVPISDLLKNIAFCNKYGIKTLYYSNTNDDSDEEPSSCEGGACAV